MKTIVVCLMVLCCACSSTSIEPLPKEVADANDSSSSSDASVADSNVSDSKFGLPEIMAIPDALAYDPTYTCVGDLQHVYFIECDYGDAEPCDFKDCRIDIAPVCVDGHCYPMK